MVVWSITAQPLYGQVCILGLLLWKLQVLSSYSTVGVLVKVQ